MGMKSDRVWYHSLHNRLILYMVVSTLLPLLLLGAVSFHLSKTGLNDQANDLTAALLRQEVSNIEGFARDARRLASNLSESEPILSIVERVGASQSLNNIERLRLKARIEERLGSTLSLQGLIAIDVVVHDLVFSIGDLSAGKRFDYELFKRWMRHCEKQRRSLCWPGIENNTHLDSQYGFVVPAISRITRFDEASASYQTLAILVLKYDVEKLYEEVHSHKTDLMYHIITDANQRIVYHPHKSRLKGSFELPEEYQKTPYGRRYVMNLDGDPVRVLNKSIPSMGWNLAGIIATDVLQQRAVMIGRLSIACCLFAIVLMALAVLYLSKKVVRPIEKITELAKCRDTSPSQLISTTRITEINQLVHWFNQYKEIVDKDKAQQEELRIAYEELQQTQQRLVESEKMAALGSIVAGVAHEINTPIGVSITANSMLQERLPALSQRFDSGDMTRSELADFLEQGQEVAEILSVNLRRAAELVTRFKRTAANQNQDFLTEIQLLDYIQDVVDSLRPAIREYRLSLTIEGDKDIAIHSYPGILWQIITNLIMNSLHHGFDPEHEGHISIKVQSQQDQVAILYRDDGKGIRLDDLPKIFEPFFTTRRHAGNTGLGLNMIYNLVVQKLNGHIECDSEQGHGVLFTIRLPISVEIVSD